MFTFDGKTAAQEQLLARFKWRKVEVPRSWNPRSPGQVLIGFYAGRTTRNGAFGQYDVVLVLVPGDGAYMVSGVKLMQLLDASMIDTGHPIQIVYNGEKDLGDKKSMKLFDLLVAEGDPIDAAAMPNIGPIT
jgi:hypothetical protein